MDSVDIEVGRHALRTFAAIGRRGLSSVTQIYEWKSDSLIAECTLVDPYLPLHDDKVPALHCTCGIYGALSLDVLASQYTSFARERVAVFAAEGTTYIGDRGLRTEAARIVAYWGSCRKETRRMRRVFPRAKKYTDLSKMLSDYDFPQSKSALHYFDLMNSSTSMALRLARMNRMNR